MLGIANGKAGPPGSLPQPAWPCRSEHDAILPAYPFGKLTGLVGRNPLYLQFNLFKYADAMVSGFSDPTDMLLVTKLGLPPEAIQTIPHRIREGFCYWQGLRRGRLMPARCDIDPLDIRTLLPGVVLLDVNHQPSGCRNTDMMTGLDFRFRLVGTEVAARSAHDYTGRRLADIPHMAPDTPFWQHREQVVRSRRPLYNIPSYVGPARQIRSCHNLLMPLSEDGNLVNMIFCLVTFEQRVSQTNVAF
jgi:hypothetical protein